MTLTVTVMVILTVTVTVVTYFNEGNACSTYDDTGKAVKYVVSNTLTIPP